MYDRLNSWAELRAMFRRFGRCDDGGIAEGNSEAVARLLADHWNALPQLETMSRVDPGFRDWVRRRVDETLALKDIRKIELKAESNCPPHHSTLRNDVRRAAAGG